MAVGKGNSNTYEEARNQRLHENKKRFEDMGIVGISKSLTKLSTPEKKAKQWLSKPKAANTGFVEPRRSSRTRTTASYTDDVDIVLPPVRKKGRFSSSSLSRYAERPRDEVKVATFEDRARALKAAEEFHTSLQSGKPSFIKSMLQSHVYRGFWLGLPSTFCNEHLPKKDLEMILEDEKGSTCEARYLGDKNGLSGGWRAFALGHKLDDGDAVVFELVDSEKFKLYTFRASSQLSSQTQVDVAEEDGSIKETDASENQNKLKPHSTEKENSKKARAAKVLNFETSKPQNESSSEVISTDMNSVEKNGVVEENDGKDEPKKETSRATKVSNDETLKPQNESASEMMISSDMNSVEKNGVIEANNGKDESAAVNVKADSLEVNEKQKKKALKPRKKPAERLFRRKV